VEVLQIALPAVVTVERSINEPRYPSLPGIMKAKRTPIAVKTLTDLGLTPEEAGAASARSKALGFASPPQRQAGRVLEGDPAQVVKELVRFLREDAKVL
jgi:electron transfer flavoprotein beta subunit